ncbi:hypothetical protein [Cytobacillus massiliigabonensis]|uniref:hypothetical protein n=1 Tax=Cytobacillus massiliigabonensis TaxID=1871011 RepID=UPI000C81B457|nr:hypothetical protein [Cytobacillus massiliigabonensis]
MKKSLIIVAGLFILLVGTSLGSANEKNVYIFENPTNAKEQEIKDEIEKANNEFLREVNEDVQSSFKLDLTKYEAVELSEIFKNDEYDNLVSILMDVMIEQENGDIVPSVYIKNDEAIILEKKATGKNIYHEIKFDNEKNIWVKEVEKEKMGKVITHPNENKN